jgi:hypothetical protein
MMKFVGQKPGITLSAYDLAICEMNCIHQLMDIANVMREFNGEKLSAHERVSLYVHAQEALNAALERKAGRLAQ